MSDPWEMKRCSKCGETKLADEFGTNRYNRDGLTHWCTECRRKCPTVSLYSQVGDDLLLDTLVAPEPMDDPTYDQVVRWLWRNVDGHVINENQMAAVLLHAVDLIPFEAIGELAGLHHTTVIHHYQRGIEAMRRRYA